jgi:hypothetical protein
MEPPDFIDIAGPDPTGGVREMLPWAIFYGRVTVYIANVFEPVCL